MGCRVRTLKPSPLYVLKPDPLEVISPSVNRTLMGQKILDILSSQNIEKSVLGENGSVRVTEKAMNVNIRICIHI